MLEIVRKAMPLLAELDDAREEARIMEIKSHAYQVMVNPDGAMEATKAGLSLSRKAGDKVGECAALNNIANAYLMKHGCAGDALEAAKEAFALCTSIGNK